MLKSFKNAQISIKESQKVLGGMRPDDVDCDLMADFIAKAISVQDFAAANYWRDKFATNCM